MLTSELDHLDHLADLFHLYSFLFKIFGKVLTGNYLSKEFRTQVEDSCHTIADYNVDEEILEHFGENFLETQSELNANFFEDSLESTNSNIFSSESNSRKFSEEVASSGFTKGDAKDSTSRGIFNSSATFDNKRPPTSPSNDKQVKSVLVDSKKEETSSVESVPDALDSPPSFDDSDISFETIMKMVKSNLRQE